MGDNEPANLGRSAPRPPCLVGAPSAGVSVFSHAATWVGFPAADPSLDDPEIRHDLAALAEAGKLLAAVGVPQHDTTTLPVGHPLRCPR